MDANSGGVKGNSCSQQGIIEWRENVRKVKLKATGGHERPRETTEGNRRLREAAKVSSRAQIITDLGAVRELSPLPTPPGPLKLHLFGEFKNAKYRYE